jgi:uncharacterized protein
MPFSDHIADLAHSYWSGARYVAVDLALDVGWLWLTYRLTRRRLLRLAATFFALIQIVVMICNQLDRRAGAEIERALPPVLSVAERIWHVGGLGFTAMLAVVFLGSKLVGGRWRKHGHSVCAPTEPKSNNKGLTKAHGISRREFVRTSTAVAPMVFTSSFTIPAMLQLGLRTRRVVIPIRDLPRPLDGMTIVQVSDLHVGQYTAESVLARTVDQVNACQADLVVVTGDLINRELCDLPEALRLVRSLQGRFGTYIVEGNHDLMVNADEFHRQVKRSGIPILLDESMVITVRGAPLELLGIRWGSSVQRLAARRQPDIFPILLAHHPHAFDGAIAAKLPLTIAGHTHGGQFMLNEQVGLGPCLFRYWSGVYTRGDCHLFVSNGIGNFFPLRIQAPAEVTHLTLRRV